MTNPYLLSLAACALALAACGSKEEATKAAADAPTHETLIEGKPKLHGSLIQSVELASPLNQDWVAKGKATYEMKCLACHKLTDQKPVVVPAGRASPRNAIQSGS
jgi:cytochrome c5